VPVDAPQGGRSFPARLVSSRYIGGTHFTWTEVIGAGRSGYTTMPNGPFRLPNGDTVTPRKNARRHAARLELLRARLNRLRKKHGLSPTGIHVLSWARSWAHNVEVGGASRSQHLYFLATDHAVQEVDRLCPWPGGRGDFDLIANDVFAKDGFGQYPAGNRHVDSRGYRARWTTFVPAWMRR
jgi:hypothetical protein